MIERIKKKESMRINWAKAVMNAFSNFCGNVSSQCVFFNLLSNIIIKARVEWLEATENKAAFPHGWHSEEIFFLFFFFF